MTILESYSQDRTMRAAYYRMNSIIHAEIWDSEDGTGYQVALCPARREGWYESPIFVNPVQCARWARNYCPELVLRAD